MIDVATARARYLTAELLTRGFQEDELVKILGTRKILKRFSLKKFSGKLYLIWEVIQLFLHVFSRPEGFC